MSHDEVAQWFAADGRLADQVEGYRPREGQIEMGRAVLDALQDRDQLIVEAGTGTGKTFAYLLPVLLNGGKAIVSTGTRNLQDQLFHRDLPTVTSAFGAPVKIALLKGRGNYLCLYRMEQAGVQDQGRISPSHLSKVINWSKETRTGDTAELTEIGEGAAIWPWVTSTTDNCLGQECPAFHDCHVFKARRKAQAADVVVVNHHLLLADFRLKDEGFGDLLPGVDAVVLDEAHQFPEIAAGFFGVRLSARQISGLLRDVESEVFAAGLQVQETTEAVSLCKAATARLRETMGRSGAGRQNLKQAPPALFDAMGITANALIELAQVLEPLDGHSKGIDNCRRRAHSAASTLQLLQSQDDPNSVAWLEVMPQGFQFQQAPLDVSKQLAEILSKPGIAWVFTSATLAVGEGFDHFAGRMGLVDPKGMVVDSHFDFQRNALLLVPSDLPDPADQQFTEDFVALADRLLKRLAGGAFLLFTSYRALNIAKGLLSSKFKTKRTLLVQGDQPRDELLRLFREDGQAILLGTSSFWEGVDVRGSALSLVMIDKLPFASPGDPLLQARLDALRQQGVNPFMHYQLPAAVLALKQGVGRLIRDVDDRGLCVIGDSRLFSKGYGKNFLSSLPPMPVTRDEAAAHRFVRDMRDAT